MLRVRQSGRHQQVYQDKELMRRAATHPQTMFEPIEVRGKKDVFSSETGRELKQKN